MSRVQVHNKSYNATKVDFYRKTFIVNYGAILQMVTTEENMANLHDVEI